MAVDSLQLVAKSNGMDATGTDTTRKIYEIHRGVL